MLWFWRLWHILFHESPRGHHCRGVPEMTMHKSTKPGLNEEEYLALVERIQRAMCIEPFRPDVTDVVVLIGTCRMLDREVKRLRAALEKIEAGYEHRLSAAELASIARQAL